ncbi:MAG TPA: hypothetical protein VL651_06100 [Bacteroidia bacterium]|nr:hypothetical protein [Bacteroidia bacterium]
MNAFETHGNGNTLLKFYFGKWKMISTVVITCTLIAFVSAFFIPKRYLGRAMFFVPSDVSIDKVMENNQIGYDVEADRVLEIIGSEQVKDSVVKKFGLVSYFGIDTTQKDWPQQLDNIYRLRIVASRTNIMAVVIQAETKDPQLSARIADYVMRCTERVRERMYKTNTGLAEQIYKAQYDSKKAEQDSLENKITTLRKSTSTNYPLLSNTFIADGNMKSNDPDLEVLTQQFINGNNRLNDIQLKYENARDVNAQPVSRFYIIDNGYPVYEPVFPKRTFLAGMAFFGSLFFMMAVLYFRYAVKNIFPSL